MSIWILELVLSKSTWNQYSRFRTVRYFLLYVQTSHYILTPYITAGWGGSILSSASRPSFPWTELALWLLSFLSNIWRCHPRVRRRARSLSLPEDLHPSWANPRPRQSAQKLRIILRESLYRYLLDRPRNYKNCTNL